MCREIPVLGIRAVPQKVTATLPSGTAQRSHQHCGLVCWWKTRLLSSCWCCHQGGRFAHPYNQQRLQMEVLLWFFFFLSLIYKCFASWSSQKGRVPWDAISIRRVLPWW